MEEEDDGGVGSSNAPIKVESGIEPELISMFVGVAAELEYLAEDTSVEASVAESSAEESLVETEVAIDFCSKLL